MPEWTPGAWRKLTAKQQPQWPDLGKLAEAEKELAGRPPLIYAGEARTLRAELARAARGEAFVLQAGDCAETFEEFSADRVKNQMKVILQLAAVLTYSAGLPVVKIGRMAGQFAKPRSADVETVEGVSVPSYRGDMVNRAHFSDEARRPNPNNLLQAYEQASATLNLLRGFATGGFADLESVRQWNREFIASSSEGERYEAVAGGIDAALRFMHACGVDATQLHRVDFYTSHEALILPYEEALTRQDSTFNDEWYDCSAHMLWIGTRTKDLDKAHVEFLRGVHNPIGCKIGGETDGGEEDGRWTPQEVVDLCERLNPDREEGRLTLVARMGQGKVADLLPPIIDAVKNAGHPVLWMCDPMHGNTFTSEVGLKTRSFDDVFSEIEQYFIVHQEAGTWPGGIHLEMTGDNVTECLGGSDDLTDDQLPLHYQTTCDPRLNARQSLDLAFRMAELLETVTST